MSLTEQLHDPVRLEQMQVAAVDETMQALEQFRPVPLDPAVLFYQLQATQAVLEREREERRRLQDALRLHIDKTEHLIAHLKATGRLQPCFNLPVSAEARAALAADGSTRPADASTAAPRIDTKDDGAGVPA